MVFQEEGLRFEGVNKTEVCIVGAGVAGITLAREFLSEGYEVMVLESGNFYPDSEANSLTGGKNTGVPYYDLPKARARAFGGSSHLWHVKMHDGSEGVRLRPLDEIDFEKREWLPYSGWPFSKAELVPYYERAHDVFGIGPYNYNTNYWHNQSNGRSALLNGENVRTEIFRFARKETFYAGHWDELNKSDKIKVYLNSTVLNINLDEYGQTVRSLDVSLPGEKRVKVEADIFVLAQGGLEIPRLMLLSNDVMAGGVGNQNDLVGRFFIEHPHLWSGTFYPKDLSMLQRLGFYQVHFKHGFDVMGKLALSEECMRKERLYNNTVSLHFTPMLRLRKAKESVLKLAKNVRQGAVGQGFGRNVMDVVRQTGPISYVTACKLMGFDKKPWYGNRRNYHGFLMNIMAEQAPDPESRVQLSDEKDSLGQPKIALNWKLSSGDINSIRRFQEILAKEFKKNGIGHLAVEMKNDQIPKGVHGGYHHMGTTRMHTDPKQGVVDQNCKVHGIHNLYVAGSSVFPTGGYANPTLTIVALAIRLGDHLKKEMSAKRVNDMDTGSTHESSLV